MELSRSFPSVGSHYSGQDSWVWFLYCKCVEVRSESQCQPRRAFGSNSQRAGWGADMLEGNVPSHPTALLSQDWGSSARSPGSQSRDMFIVNASFELSLLVGCMAMDSC